MSKPVGTLDQIAEYLIRGYWKDKHGPNAQSIKWATSDNSPIPVDLSRLDEKGQFLARTALEMWTSATGLAFEEVGIDRNDGRGGNDRGILFQYGATTHATWHKYDSNGWHSWSIDIRRGAVSNALSKDQSGEYTVTNPRSLFIFIHEIGHALGLGHPGDYNGGASYPKDVKFANDSWQATVMSYVSQTQNTSLDASYAHPATPMSADILAIEKLYGDSNAIRTGDTVYGFNSSAGGFLDALARHMNASHAFTFTLIDDGGSDTFDYSGATQGSRVDLTPGAVSDVFGGKGNMVVYRDTVIEHFVGGSGNDEVTGNDADNMLIGGDGDDVLDGGAGDDRLDGGKGADTLTGGTGADTFRYASSAFGADRITDFEDGTDTIDFRGSGLSYADLAIGDSGRDKVVDAGSGNTITLVGQAGATIDAADFSFGAAALGVSIGDVTVAEGGVARFVLRLSALPETAVTVDWRTRDGTAVAGEDYTGVGQWQTVTFAPGQLHRVVEVRTSSDAVFEHDESFSVELGNPVGAVLDDGTGEASLQNRTPRPRVSIDDVQVDEGGAAVFTVSLDRVSAADVTVEWTTQDGRAVSGDDYTGVDQARTLTIPAGQQSGTISVRTLDNGAWKDDNHFFVALSNPVGAVLADGKGKAVIEENDARPLTVSIDDVQVDEGDAAVFTVSLDRVSGADVTVEWTTQDGVAVSGDDYTGVDQAQTLTIPAGQQSGTISVRTLDNGAWKDDNHFFVALSNPVGAVLADGKGKAVIEENDARPPTVSISDGVGTEGGLVEFEVGLDRVWHTDVSVRVNVDDGSAERSVDYSASHGKDLVIPAGQLGAKFEVRTFYDKLDEPDETFKVTLSSPGKEFPLGRATATGTIRNLDTSQLPAPPTVSVGDVTVTESDGEVRVPIHFDRPFEPGERMFFRMRLLDDSAESGRDYRHMSPSEVRQVFVVQGDGTDQAFLTRPLNNDDYPEDDEQFVLEIFDVEGATLADGAGIITIVDDDVDSGTLPYVHTGAGSYVTEGGHAVFAVKLSEPTAQDVTVRWEIADRGAEGGKDYDNDPTTGTVTIPAGQRAAPVIVETFTDDETEGQEKLVFKLLAATGATVHGRLDWNMGTIADYKFYRPGISISDVTVTEGGKAHFFVTLDHPYFNGAVLDWSTSDGTAEGGSDFLAVTDGQVFIPAMSKQARITVDTLVDAVREGDETFTVTLSNLRGLGYLKDATGTATVVDGPSLPQLSIDDVTVDEGGPAQFTVRLDKTWTDDVTVDWDTTDGTATDGSDYTGQSGGTLTIQAGQRSATVEVQTTDDGDDESDETFTVTLSNPVNAVLGDDTGEATVTDNDDPPPKLSIDDVTVDEGGQAQLTVRLSKPAAHEVTVYWLTAEGTAVAWGDYLPSDMTGGALPQLVFRPGETTKVVTLDTLDDATHEPDETFTVTLLNPEGAALGEKHTATVTLTDDDAAPPPGAMHFIGGTLAADTLVGTDGDDHIDGGDANDTLDGGAGDDLLVGGRGADLLTGGAGADTFRFDTAESGFDIVKDFEPGVDKLDFRDTGLTFDDLAMRDIGTLKFIEDGRGNTVVLEGMGGRTLDAADFLFGRTYNVIVGTDRGETLEGTGAADHIEGRGGFDRLHGHGGDDILDGGGSTDSLYGGAGDDTLIGGGDNDFFYIGAGEGHDVITDFQTAGLGSDAIVFDNVTAFRTFAEMVRDHAVQRGADVVISTDDHSTDHSVTLQNVTLNQLQEESFIL